jgi:hypothetical protein
MEEQGSGARLLSKKSKALQGLTPFRHLLMKASCAPFCQGFISLSRCSSFRCNKWDMLGAAAVYFSGVTRKNTAGLINGNKCETFKPEQTQKCRYVLEG